MMSITANGIKFKKKVGKKNQFFLSAIITILFLFLMLPFFSSVADEQGACSHNLLAWDYDSGHHWLYCSQCGMEMGYSEHCMADFGYDCQAEDAEYHSYRCECGLRIRGIHSFNENNVCSNCGYNRGSSSGKSSSQNAVTPSGSSAVKNIKPQETTFEATISDEVISSARATVTELGIATSKVTITLEVDTSKLIFSSETEGGNNLAVVKTSNENGAKLYKEGMKAIYCYVPAGTILPVLSYGDETIRTHYGSYEGYLKSVNYEIIEVETTPGSGVVETDYQSINFRATPSIDSMKIGSVPKGASVAIYGEAKEWYQIEYKGKFGYIMKKFVEIEQ